MTTCDLLTRVEHLRDTSGGPQIQTKLAFIDKDTQQELYLEFTVQIRIGEDRAVFFALVPVVQLVRG